jgi:hypothetical protein
MSDSDVLFCCISLFTYSSRFTIPKYAAKFWAKKQFYKIEMAACRGRNNLSWKNSSGKTIVATAELMTKNRLM